MKTTLVDGIYINDFKNMITIIETMKSWEHKDVKIALRSENTNTTTKRSFDGKYAIRYDEIDGVIIIRDMEVLDSK